MFKKFKTVCLSIALASAFTITGCSSSSEQQYAWPLATASPEDTVTQIFAEDFAKRVYDLSDGKMKIEVYPNSTLGGADETRTRDPMRDRHVF